MGISWEPYFAHLIFQHDPEGLRALLFGGHPGCSRGVLLREQKGSSRERLERRYRQRTLHKAQAMPVRLFLGQNVCMGAVCRVRQATEPAGAKFLNGVNTKHKPGACEEGVTGVSVWRPSEVCELGPGSL